MFLPALSYYAPPAVLGTTGLASDATNTCRLGVWYVSQADTKAFRLNMKPGSAHAHLQQRPLNIFQFFPVSCCHLTELLAHGRQHGVNISSLALQQLHIVLVLALQCQTYISNMRTTRQDKQQLMTFPRQPGLTHGLATRGRLVRLVPCPAPAPSTHMCIHRNIHARTPVVLQCSKTDYRHDMIQLCRIDSCS